MRLLHKPYQLLAILTMTVLLVSGCGIFNRAENERERDNEIITSGVDLGDVVTAEGIGANNEPVGETDTFNDTQDFIYVVAEANHIDAGTTFFARWYRDDEPLEDSGEITSDRDYDNTYIEFHLENLQDRMETGDYSVQLFANGNPIAEVEFTVE